MQTNAIEIAEENARKRAAGQMAPKWQDAVTTETFQTDNSIGLLPDPQKAE